MSKFETWIKLKKNKNKKCRICGERIKEDLCVYSWASNQGYAFFHIGCIKELGNRLELLSEDELLKRLKRSPHRAVQVDGL
jgi:hypothetical protein